MKRCDCSYHIKEKADKGGICPVCLRPIGKADGRKPSFHETWGDMTLESMTRKKWDQPVADEAMNYYLQADQESGNCPGLVKVMDLMPEGIDRTAFLEDWIEKGYSSALPLLLQDSWKKHQDPKELAGLMNRYKAKASPDLYRTVMEDFPGSLLPLKHLLGALDEKTPVTFESGFILDGLLGLPDRSGQRLDWIQEMDAMGNLTAAIEGMVRPLSDPDDPFTHQIADPEFTYNLFAVNPKQGKEILLSLIEQEQALRGIHLYLQFLKARAAQDQTGSCVSDVIDSLLEKHFEKTYMKSFEWIEGTDWVF